MKQIESIPEFYNSFPENSKVSLPLDNTGAGHFNVFPREYCTSSITHRRRDFYKIALIIGEGIITSGENKFIVSEPALLFSNPLIPYSWEATSKEQKGWFCLFTEEFIRSEDYHHSKQNHPIYRLSDHPLICLDKDLIGDATYIFKKMMQEMSSDYIHKYSILQNYVNLLIHLTIKSDPTASIEEQHSNSAQRITFKFLDLLEKQFPIESPSLPLKLKTANDYAKCLFVHVNHLNHSVKEITGKTSTQHITSRIIQEAKALLSNTNWAITEIAYSLGFEYPSHFTNFFRKHTGEAPGKARDANL